MEQTRMFEIGEWVNTEDGLGQVLYVRAIYFQEFDRANKIGKKGDFIRYLYICKILSDFNGVIKKRFKINVYTSITRLNKIEKEFIDNIKRLNKEKYIDYILFEPKESLSDQIFLNYKVSNDKVDSVVQGINDIRKNLPRTFSFNEFKKEFGKHKMPFDVNSFLKKGEINNRSETITIRLDSYLFKNRGKETLFIAMRAIKLG